MGKKLFKAIVLILSSLGLFIAIDYVFHLRLVPIPLDLSYLYGILAIYGSLAFLFFHARGRAAKDTPWYDWLLFLFVIGSAGYLSVHGLDVIEQGWSMAPPLHTVILVLPLWFVLIEGVRRTGGLPLSIVALFFSLYPLLAPYLPGLLWGPPIFSLSEIAAYHFMSNTAVMGIPMTVVGTIVIGYIIFGVTLQHTGGGRFFLDLALSLMGPVRGGVAKVAIVSSGLFGSLSGAVASNVVATGSLTIPAMKKTGYPAHYAGAVETCASTGGSLMPPVMGAAAFVMAETLGISYYTIAAAAALPAILYYLGLFTQADAYAARVGIKGLDRSEVPRLSQTLKEGWPYIFSFLVLLFYLFYLRRVAQAPFLATATLIVFTMLRKDTRLTLKSFVEYIISTGKFLAQLTLILSAVGFIMGSFSITGLGATFSHSVARLAGGNVALLLIFGAATSFILGMGMTVTAVYIFLAITVAPSLVLVGINLMAAHLFILYYGILSYITPPVAIAAYAASPIAGASPMNIGFTATRMALIIYIIPFFFVISPALVLQGSLADIALHFITAVLGIILLSGSLERYILGIGIVKWPLAILFFLAGLMLFYPSWQVSLAGLGIGVVTYAATLWKRRL
ncbi:TRAP transporter permease [Chloroflexota bacterium]